MVALFRKAVILPAQKHLPIIDLLIPSTHAMKLEHRVKINILFAIFASVSSTAFAVDKTACSSARDNYIDIQVRETRRCCNDSYTKEEAIESANEAIEDANSYSSVEDLKEELTSVSRMTDKLMNQKGNNSELSHFVLHECLLKSRLRELRNYR